MPNWCENSVTIRHKNQDKLKKLQEAMVNGKFLDSVIPVPEELKNEKLSSFGGPDKDEKDALRRQMLEKHGYESWYDFCVDNWGTKWEVTVDDPVLEDGELTASFSSAWSPPIGVYEELTKLGFDVDAKFYESGEGFAGTYTSEDDEMMIYNCDSMPEELDDFFGHSTSLLDDE